MVVLPEFTYASAMAVKLYEFPVAPVGVWVAVGVRVAVGVGV